jgi:hypothetical protein
VFVVLINCLVRYLIMLLVGFIAVRFIGVVRLMTRVC